MIVFFKVFPKEHGVLPKEMIGKWLCCPREWSFFEFYWGMEDFQRKNKMKFNTFIFFFRKLDLTFFFPSLGNLTNEVGKVAHSEHLKNYRFPSMVFLNEPWKKKFVKNNNMKKIMVVEKKSNWTWNLLLEKVILNHCCKSPPKVIKQHKYKSARFDLLKRGFNLENDN
jgi:hypothetical protein